MEQKINYVLSNLQGSMGSGKGQTYVSPASVAIAQNQAGMMAITDQASPQMPMTTRSAATTPTQRRPGSANAGAARPMSFDGRWQNNIGAMTDGRRQQSANDTQDARQRPG